MGLFDVFKKKKAPDANRDQSIESTQPSEFRDESTVARDNSTDAPAGAEPVAEAVVGAEVAYAGFGTHNVRLPGIAAWRHGLALPAARLHCR